MLKQHEEAKGQLEEVWDFTHEMSRTETRMNRVGKSEGQTGTSVMGNVAGFGS